MRVDAVSHEQQYHQWLGTSTRQETWSAPIYLTGADHVSGNFIMYGNPRIFKVIYLLSLLVNLLEEDTLDPLGLCSLDRVLAR